jgi:hypothetical protein
MSDEKKRRCRKYKTSTVLHRLATIRDLNLDKALRLAELDSIDHEDAKQSKTLIEVVEKSINTIHMLQGLEEIGSLKGAEIKIAGFEIKMVETDAEPVDEEDDDEQE